MFFRQWREQANLADTDSAKKYAKYRENKENWKNKVYNGDGTTFRSFNQSDHPVGDGACAGFAILGKVGESYISEAIEKQEQYVTRTRSGEFFRKLYMSRYDFFIRNNGISAKMYTEIHPLTRIIGSPYMGNSKESADYFRNSSENYSKPLYMMVSSQGGFWGGRHAISLTCKGNGFCKMLDANTGKVKGKCEDVYEAYKWTLDHYVNGNTVVSTAIEITADKSKLPKIR